LGDTKLVRGKVRKTKGQNGQVKVLKDGFVLLMEKGVQRRFPLGEEAENRNKRLGKNKEQGAKQLNQLEREAELQEFCRASVGM